VVVQVALVWFLIRYRGRPGRKAHYTHGSLKAEVIWTSVTAVTVIILGLMSGGVWDRIKGHHSAPDGALPVAVHASQFEWNATHAGPTSCSAPAMTSSSGTRCISRSTGRSW
jgi:heme/copper-type cytochrome/quinol oxidase subunit 2